MGRQIDMTKPLSDEDKQWLRDRSRGWQIDEAERIQDDAKRKGDLDPVVEEEWKPTNTVAAAPFEDREGNPLPHLDTRQVPYPVDINGEHVERSEGEVVNPEAENVEEVAPEDLTVEELKDELHERDLPVSGNKDELVKRLKKALRDEEK